MRSLGAFLVIIVTCSVPALSAHHSFAVYFEAEKIVEVTGVVTSFRFTNPHGIIELSVKNKNGQMETWKAETNAPVILRRRGWTPTSLKPGEVVTIEGWAGKGGAHYLRMRRVTRADGTQVGATISRNEAEDKEN